MGYTFTCNGCDEKGENPALMAQFNKDTFLNHPFGDRIQERGYELGDTVTLCTDCAYDLLEPQR
jgi:hypothetical protein